MLRYTYITFLVYQATLLSFIEILMCNYNNQTLDYLFYHSLSIHISHIILFLYLKIALERNFNLEISSVLYFVIK